MRSPIPEELEQIAKDVVDAAIKLHIALGPGLLGPQRDTAFARASGSKAMQKELPYQLLF